MSVCLSYLCLRHGCSATGGLDAHTRPTGGSEDGSEEEGRSIYERSSFEVADTEHFPGRTAGRPHAKLRTETRNFPFSVLGLWGKHTMARAVYMPFYWDIRRLLQTYKLKIDDFASRFWF